MTAQLAKAVERLLQGLFSPVLMTEVSIGENQFAYCKGRGSRDAIAFLMLSWMLAFQEKKRIALYMSDVSAAFDRVFMNRLVEKLKARRVPQTLLNVFVSWLQARRAVVVVGGSSSEEFALQNMVFQGTVWGPILWNVFYEDASSAIRSKEFTEIVFADDLNAFKIYDSAVGNDTIICAMGECQDELHKWGRANQVVFDASKESKHILSRKNPHGPSFNLLGVRFDCKLLMTDTVADLVKTCRWKLKSLLRTRSFNTGAQLVLLYKAQLLSFIEYRTIAIYHACESALSNLDRVQSKLLEAAGMDDVEALNHCRLAPLSSRRDIALLGLIHRTVLEKGPGHFKRFFRADVSARVEGRGNHRMQLVEYTGGHWTDFRYPNSRPADYIKYSMLGLVTIYNRLPARVVEGCGCVPSFQTALQNMLTERANSGVENWRALFSPRVPWYRHPLR